ncbi:DUF4097 family beta strand repeat-containing protein [Paenibacillus sp. MMS20-IR301]|uniref:DUF4097 family beta strand repeat-containing protein n=1 Tax=Paenibacillus sp. MMS20-IR301 TaxID=2895946 RepID=UPI0028E468CA|nr:DUF4097 family beta strand repeat-containing protein [Paenibacillus sp. MMS20-IR301]WNS44168.1 DUF4097 family beta strand repeat-containing protein [Paenibacillus sp. MMS20-IR301]
MKRNKWVWISMVVVLAGILVITLLNESKDFNLTGDIPASEIQSIEINNDSWNVVVKESMDNEIHLDIEGNQTDKKKAPVAVTRKSNSLVIQQVKQIGGALSAFTFHQAGTITVFIPQNTVGQVRMINNIGDIEIQTLATHSLVIENKAGNMKLNQVTADSGDYNLAEGDLNIKDSSFERIDVIAKGNDLYFKNVTSSVMNLYSKSGEIILGGVVEQGETRVETKSGEIQVNYQTAPASLKVAVENTKGDMEVHLPNLLAAEKTDQNVSGTIGAGENSLFVKSYSGSIGIK